MSSIRLGLIIPNIVGRTDNGGIGSEKESANDEKKSQSLPNGHYGNNKFINSCIFHWI